MKNEPKVEKPVGNEGWDGKCSNADQTQRKTPVALVWFYESLVVLAVGQKGVTLQYMALTAFWNTRKYKVAKTQRKVSFESEDKFNSGQAQGRGERGSTPSPFLWLRSVFLMQWLNPVTDTRALLSSPHLGPAAISPQNRWVLWRDRHNVLLALFQWSIEIMPWKLNCQFFSNQH